MAVTINETTLGDGVVKVCVPIVGANEKEILAQAAEAAGFCPDFLEWRADYFEGLTDTKRVLAVIEELGVTLGALPMIFTVRTKEEGGLADVSGACYSELLVRVLTQGIIKLADVEIYKSDIDAADLIKRLKGAGGYVLASSHHFDTTPEADAMRRTLDEMETLGADILKLAVMPKCMEDVLSLLKVTMEKSRTSECPVITMSMGRMGTISRVSGARFGSALTFATVGPASAPGQIPIEDMRVMLKNI